MNVREDMDKKIKALVKERDGLARRCTTLDKSILEMVNDVRVAFCAVLFVCLGIPG